MSSLYHQASYFDSAAKLEQLPPDTGIEVAFAGRSNAGKSSALNAITQQKKLARTSKTPGRTQLINLFRLDDERRLVDLPGYGFAKVPLAIKRRWEKTLQDYLVQRDSLRGLILLMDIRHPMKELDHAMLDWAIESQLPTHILLTKADKLKYGPAKNVLLQLQKQWKSHNDLISIQLFSALKNQGLDTVKQRLNEWFDLQAITEKSSDKKNPPS